jgi:hypothetical protein
MRKFISTATVSFFRLFGSTLRDVETGEVLGRAFVFTWRGRVHVIGLERPVRPVFLQQQRITYWQQAFGFTANPPPDFPNERRP